jgi:large subunit ribosomal protein L19
MANAADLIRSIENTKEEIPDIAPGDTVRIHVRIVEGERERVQVFQGVIIRIRGGGINKTFTVRRIASHGVGVERTFLLHSPRVEKIEVLRHAHVRRAKLYFLRQRSGKSARLRERRD